MYDCKRVSISSCLHKVYCNYRLTDFLNCRKALWDGKRGFPQCFSAIQQNQSGVIAINLIKVKQLFDLTADTEVGHDLHTLISNHNKIKDCVLFIKSAVFEMS